MITKSSVTMFLMAAALILSAPLVYAEDQDGGNLPSDQTSVPADQGGWKHDHHKEGSFFNNLTDDQKKQLKANREKQREAAKVVLGQIKSTQETLNQELIKPTPDTNKINQIQTQLKALQAQMLDNRLNAMLEMKKILTPEQYAKFLEAKKEHKFGEHKGAMHKRE